MFSYNAELITDRLVPDQWRVEAFTEDGGCDVAIFHGPNGLHNAICFAGSDVFDGWSDPEALGGI